jgi:hypothetical protein
MKKNIFVMVLAIAVLFPGCKKETKDFTIIGQLYNTWSHGSQEKMKGKVRELKQTHFWAAEENGKVVKGKPVTAEDRKTTPLGRDFVEQYNESGTTTRYTSFSDDGKPAMDVKADVDGKIFKGAQYFLNDTIWGYAKYKYDGDKLIEADGFNPHNDSLMSSIKYTYDANGYISKIQAFDSKGQSIGYVERTRNTEGLEVVVSNFDGNGKETSQLDYTYNSKGEKINHHQQIFTSGKTIDYTHKYVYDKMGNATAIIVYKDGKPFIYRAREIKYYE